MYISCNTNGVTANLQGKNGTSSNRANKIWSQIAQISNGGSLCVLCAHKYVYCCRVCIVVVVLCVCVLLSYVYLLYCVGIAFFFTLDAGLLARSQYSEGPATGHLDTGSSLFPCA